MNRRRLHDRGATSGGNSQAEFAAVLCSELDKWGGVIQRAGVRAD